jgi:CDP-6-deoxy-D-xylo-4-hexulose-3-dehydrase
MSNPLKKEVWSEQAAKLSAVAPPKDDETCAELRREILELCRKFKHAQKPPAFVPGKTIIPASAKVLDDDDLVSLVDASLDLWLTTGRYAERFEQELGQVFGVKHARLTVSGSAANLLAFTALTSPRLNDRRLVPGDEVITVAAGFPTTVFPIIQNRCVPTFVDVELETANIDVNRLEAALSPRTRAVMLAHTLGNPFRLDEVTAFCKQYDLFLVEDCCDALGSTYRDRHVGSFGDLATVSFYPAHHITTGEGGAVLMRSLALMRLVESFRDWGRDCQCHTGMNNTCEKRFGWQLGSLPFGYDHKFIYSHIGYNLKVTDMQAALGCSQLQKLPAFIASRKANFATLRQRFIDEGLEEHLILPTATPHSDPSWFGFLLTIRDGSPLKRVDAIRYLDDRKIMMRLLFAGNLTRQPALQGVEYRVAGDLSVTDKIMGDTFWVGLYPGIGQAHIDYMIETFRSMVRDLVA